MLETGKLRVMPSSYVIRVTRSHVIGKYILVTSQGATRISIRVMIEGVTRKSL